jgi:chloramphenicol-sensitive protein RarD
MQENPITLNMLLICAGIVTTAPLLCFTAATKRMTLSALGFFQYIGPSIMFLLATFYYQEPLYAAKLITFACLWTALAIYSVDSIKARKRAKNVVATQ